MKRKISLVVALMLMTLTVFGCGKREELENTPSSSLSDIINEEQVTDEKLADEECPEGYVYDYQVSMEPIPAEIAALGGDVCGTIHAYPTKIQIELVKQEIENSEELKEENDTYLAVVRQYLDDTYGGEFEIAPIAIDSWRYVCIEKATDKRFIISINPLYSKYQADVDIIYIDSYYYEENASVYKEDLNNIMKNLITDNHIYRVFQEKLDEYKKLQLHIANASLVSLAITNVTSAGNFIVFRSHPSSTIIAFAPAFIASFMYECPSVANPFIAINISPSFMFFELLSMLFTSISRLPFAFKPSIPTNIFFSSIFLSPSFTTVTELMVIHLQCGKF